MSGLRTLGADFNQAVVAAIDTHLRAVAEQEDATLLLAIESGSRAWGFPSPDSDYDCRFIYARAPEDYLRLYPPRDVIEFPIDSALDVNGWDLAKALRLLLKGNAVVIEWLTSPFVYAGSDTFRQQALVLARQVARPDAVARHYLHLGERQRRTHFADERAIEIKRLFYALRPALALRWLRMHRGEAVAPMHFPTLVAQSDVPAGIGEIINDLLARKAVTRELGTGELPRPIGNLIDAEFTTAREFWPSSPWHPDTAMVAAADAFFQSWLPR